MRNMTDPWEWFDLATGKTIRSELEAPHAGIVAIDPAEGRVLISSHPAERAT